MKAMVFHGPRDLRYDDVPDPVLSGRRDMIVRVRKCSICGSDLHMYRGKKIGPVDYATTPMRFCVGHEAIGEVVEVGASVTRHRVGDRVLMAGGVGCGRCDRCARGAFSLCESGAVIPYGFSPLLQGLQAEFAVIRQADLSAMRIPEGVGDEQALLLTDALATGYLGAERAAVRPGSDVAVFGMGPIGRTAMESAFALGAARVFAVEPSAHRRASAEARGAIALAPEEAKDGILGATSGRGVDSVVEAVGKEETIRAALRIARRGGHVAILGLVEREMKTSLAEAQLKSLSVFAGVAGVADAWPALVPLVQSGKLRADGMFSHTFPLSMGADAFALFDGGQDTVSKVLLEV